MGTLPVMEALPLLRTLHVTNSAELESPRNVLRSTKALDTNPQSMKTAFVLHITAQTDLHNYHGTATLAWEAAWKPPPRSTNKRCTVHMP